MSDPIFTPALPPLAPGATVADLGEAALIARIRHRVPKSPSWVPVSIGDDAAVVEPARGTLDVVTTDTLVEGIHFHRSFVSATDLGYRALAVNLSDLAAMGASPRAALLSLVLPPPLPAADIDDLLDGLLGLAGRHDMALVGGNITRSPGPLVVGITAMGTVRRRRVLTRDTGQPGDELWVTGTLGAAAAGLGWLRTGQTTPGDRFLEACVSRYRRPEARVRVGTLLGRNRSVRAAVDLSDGLSDGIRQIAAASATGAVIDSETVPIDPGARAWFEQQGADPIAAAIAGGDDYELLVSVPRAFRRRFHTIRRLTHGVPMTRIGELTRERELILRSGAGDQPLPEPWAHFGDYE